MSAQERGEGISLTKEKKLSPSYAAIIFDAGRLDKDSWFFPIAFGKMTLKSGIIANSDTLRSSNFKPLNGSLLYSILDPDAKMMGIITIKKKGPALAFVEDLLEDEFKGPISEIPFEKFTQQGLDLSDPEEPSLVGRIINPNLSQMLYDFQLQQGRFKPQNQE